MKFSIRQNDHVTLGQVQAAMASHEPSPGEINERARQAAVAVIIAGEQDNPLLCLIRRAENEEDPWSGQMALPGGRVEDTDANPCDAAVRETREEIGLRLGPKNYLGPLNEMAVFARGRDTGIGLFSYVFVLQGDPPRPQPNHEVSEVYWKPLQTLLEPDQWDQVHYQRNDLDLHLPSIRCGDHHIWGLTYRVIAEFFSLLGHVLPEDPFLKRRV